MNYSLGASSKVHHDHALEDAQLAWYVTARSYSELESSLLIGLDGKDLIITVPDEAARDFIELNISQIALEFRRHSGFIFHSIYVMTVDAPNKFQDSL